MTSARADLICPKCGGPMRSLERGRVILEQCGDCRGIFLDRGELEQLIDAESSYYESRGYEAPDPNYYGGRQGGGEHGGERRGHGGGKRRRGGFFGGLFDD